MSELQPASTNDVTVLLTRVRQGDRLATDELLPRVYQELRALAEHHLSQEHSAHTLQATALVHEAYLRLVGPAEVTWENRRHFFGAASQAIRRILTDHARTKRRQKRGAGMKRVALHEDLAAKSNEFDVLAVDEALNRLAAIDPRKAQLVELKFFGGLSMEEISEMLGVPIAGVTRQWQFARAWLHRELSIGRGP